MIPPNIQHTIIKNWLPEQIYHQIYSRLIPVDTILCTALVYSAETGSNPEGVNSFLR